MLCRWRQSLSCDGESMLRLFRAGNKSSHSERDRYRHKGFQIFRDALDAKAVEAVAMQARTIPAYDGKLLRQNGAVEVNDFIPNSRLIRNSLANPHLPLNPDVEPFSAALTRLLSSQALIDHLKMLDGAKSYIIHQVLCFFAAQTTELHIDSWAVDTVPRGYAHTLWIPLQDMGSRSGMPAVMSWPLGKYLSESDLGVEASGDQAERYERYHHAFERRLLDERPEFTTALLRRGDFFVWSSLTPHLTLPSLPHPMERLSLQVLVKPVELRRGSFLEQPEAWFPERAIKVNDNLFFYVPETIHANFGIDGGAEFSQEG